jgi:hypothetical protein
MISLPKLKFDLSEKRALFITVNAVTVYHWEKNSITDAFSFDVDDMGIANFARYLEQSRKLPLYILVDIVEEEYRQDTIPHVHGSDRRTVLQRKQSRMFRGTPYCHTLVQGREAEGRRDDKVLLTGIMNPEIVNPWVKQCLQHKIPLAGIYSLPILSRALLSRLNAKATNTLLVTMQSNSGLRQSYFRDGHLKVSRLAIMPRLGAVPFVQFVLDELDRTQRYLKNMRLMGSGPLEIHLLSHGELLDGLSRQCLDSETLLYHLFDVAGVAQAMGIQGALTTPFSDFLFAHLLLETSPQNHYASREDQHYFKLHRLHNTLVTAGLILMLGGSIWSGYNLMKGVSLNEQRVNTELMAKHYEARFQMAKRGLPKTQVEPLDIKTGVELIDALNQHKATPLPMMAVIGHALDRFPNLYLDEIKWTASPDPKAEPGRSRPTGQEGEEIVEPPPGINPRSHYRYYQIAMVTGHISPFDGNYRNALALINRFTGWLKSQSGVHDVQVVTQPLNISSEASLQGSASDDATTPGKASFGVKVILGVGDVAG